mgnify:CR=1 FL=1
MNSARNLSAVERTFENILYASRWLLAPIYIGLSLALVDRLNRH